MSIRSLLDSSAGKTYQDITCDSISVGSSVTADVISGDTLATPYLAKASGAITILDEGVTFFRLNAGAAANYALQATWTPIPGQLIYIFNNTVHLATGAGTTAGLTTDAGTKVLYVYDGATWVPLLKSA